MQRLVRDLQNQFISGREPCENQENVHDSGTESDEEELLFLSDRDSVPKHCEKKTLFAFGDPPSLCSSPPPQDTDSKDSFGKESGIHSDGEITDEEEKCLLIEKCTFPVMTMDTLDQTGKSNINPRTLRPRRCRVRVLVNRRLRQESESDMEINILQSEENSPPVRRRAPKRPALNLDKMMKTRLDAVPPKRERISSCSSTL